MIEHAGAEVECRGALVETAEPGVERCAATGGGGGIANISAL